MSKAFFITGTDTAVGKTLVANALLKLARDTDLDVLGLKPVAAGCEMHDGILANDDAWQLMQNSTDEPAYADVNPVALREAMAPHIAAEREGIQLDVASLVNHCKPLIHNSDFTVVEGAGGWDVPLNDRESMADLARELGLPVVLVVGIRLGCLNHALLTAQAIKQQGLIMVGWVANRIDPDMPVADENIATLVDRLPAPLLGTVPYQEDIAGNDAAEALSASLDIAPLLD